MSSRPKSAQSADEVERPALGWFNHNTVVLSEGSPASRSRRTPTLRTPPQPFDPFQPPKPAAGHASRYPEASASGLSEAKKKRGFSPWGMPFVHPAHKCQKVTKCTNKVILLSRYQLCTDLGT